ncbi:E3 ubiquitin-protein ligase TRIM39-like [Lissotriton helveticus]
MAAANHLQSLKEEATCSICLEYFTNPVSVECGHVFCLSCITRYWEGLHTDFPCPQCREISQSKTLRPNRHLANMVEILKQLQVPSPTPQQANLCRKHEEKLKLFCEDDQEPICVVCSMSRDHKAHTVLPIGEVAQEHKEEFQRYLVSLNRMLADILELQQRAEIKVKQLEDKFKSQREQITNEFDKLQRFLEKERSRHIGSLEEVEQNSLHHIKERVTRLEEKRISLQSVISDIESKCQQEDVEILKDVKSMLSRYESAKNQYMDCDTFREKEEKANKEEKVDIQKKIIESLEWRWARNFAADVTLDPYSAHRRLIVSDDRKSVRLGLRAQDLPDTPLRFRPVINVLGRERLRSGKHYWEVEVGDKTDWDLGVCDESVSRKGDIVLLPENGYWIVWLRDGEYQALSSPPFLLTPHVPPRVVGFFLDYEAGRLSVYNVDNRSLLYTFYMSSIPCVLRLCFSPYLIKGGKNAGALRILPVTSQE